MVSEYSFMFCVENGKGAHHGYLRVTLTKIADSGVDGSGIGTVPGLAENWDAVNIGHVGLVASQLPITTKHRETTYGITRLHIRGSSRSQVRELEGVILGIELGEDLLNSAGMVERDAVNCSSDEKRDDVVELKDVGGARREVGSFEGGCGNDLDRKEEDGGYEKREVGEGSRLLHLERFERFLNAIAVVKKVLKMVCSRSIL